MSSPTDRIYDPGDPSPYAPRWVRNAPQQRRAPIRSPLSPDIAAADSGEADEANLARDEHVIGREQAPPLAAAAPVAHEEPFVIDDFRVPRSLDPGIVPDPWAERRSRLRRYRVLGMLGRLALAGSAAAIVALLAIGKLSVPGSIGATEQADTPFSSGSRFSGPAVKPQEPPIVAEGASDPHLQVAMADPSAPVPAPPATAVAVAPPAPLAPAPVAAPASPPAAESAATAPASELTPEDLAALLKRGQQLAASGDIAAARLTLRPAAEAHDPQAALALGATYDPTVLRALGIFGVTPDVAMARGWYEKAKAYGSAEAPRRLELLAIRSK
jgi:hypothetical protein